MATSTITSQVVKLFKISANSSLTFSTSYALGVLVVMETNSNFVIKPFNENAFGTGFGELTANVTLTRTSSTSITIQNNRSWQIRAWYFSG